MDRSEGGCPVDAGASDAAHRPADRPWASVLRRTIDLSLAAAGLAVSGPAILAAAGWVRLRAPGPVLTADLCVGRGGAVFPLYRLRTTTDPVDGCPAASIRSPDKRFAGQVAPRADWVRRSGIDRLPRFLNVLQGDLALVGPRPELAKRLSTTFRDADRSLLTVRPGLTGAGTLYHVAHCAPLIAAGGPDEFFEARLLPVRVAVDRVGLARRGLLYDGALAVRTVGTLIARLAGRRTFPELAEMAAARAVLRREGRVITAPGAGSGPPSPRRQAA